MGTSGSAVVSIRAHSGYRPDYAKIASGKVSAAREKLGCTADQFAARLTETLGWAVRPYAIRRWEGGDAPPGDVLLACAAIAEPGETLGFTAPLLTEVPPSFPAETLAGPWVTCYQFTHAGQPQHHADIAHVTAAPSGRLRAVNHPPEPRSEGRARPFRNQIDATLVGRHLVGEWKNLSDTRYYGTLQLAVLPGETVMTGRYSGVGSDIEVSAGVWKWVRLDPGPVPVPGIALRDPHDLHDLVMAHTQTDEPLTLAEVKGD